MCKHQLIYKNSTISENRVNLGNLYRVIMKKHVKFLCKTFVFALVLSVMSCTKYSVDENQLVGRWQSESYKYTEYDKNGHPVLDVTYRTPIFLVTMELNADGTGIWVDNSEGLDSVDEGSWSLSDKKLTITMSALDIDTFDVVSVTSKELVLSGKEVYDDLTIEYKLHFKKI